MHLWFDLKPGSVLLVLPWIDMYMMIDRYSWNVYIKTMIATRVQSTWHWCNPLIHQYIVYHPFGRNLVCRRQLQAGTYTTCQRTRMPHMEFALNGWHLRPFHRGSYSYFKSRYLNGLYVATYTKHTMVHSNGSKRFSFGILETQIKKRQNDLMVYSSYITTTHNGTNSQCFQPFWWFPRGQLTWTLTQTMVVHVCFGYGVTGLGCQ
jgi:hypothetical protein